MLKRHLDLDIEMFRDGSYGIIITEPEVSMSATYYYEPGTAKDGTFEDVVEEIRSWVLLMDDNREEES